MTSRILTLGLLTCLATALPAAAQDSSPSGSWSAAQQEVIDAASRGPVGIEQDFERWAGGYHQDWSYWRLGGAAVRPRDEHMQLVRDFVDEGNRVRGYELQPVDVVVRGEVALLRFNAIERLETADGERRDVRFSSASLFVKEDGRWVCLATNIFYPPAAE